MASLPKKGFFWFLFSLLLLTAVFYSVLEEDLLEKVWPCIRSDLLTANAKLRVENEGLKDAMAVLEKQNRQLKKALLDWVSQFSTLDHDILTTRESSISSFQGPIRNLDKESFLNQQIYRALLAERKRWDAYQQSQYQGILETTLEPAVVSSQHLTFEDDNIQVTRKSEDKQTRAYHGLVRSLLQNSVIGVSEGFTKTLEIVGTGYKAEMVGNDGLKLTLGYSHPIDFKLPKGIEGKVEENVVTVSGIDKQLVGQTAALIRSIRKPEPYKGKGIKYKEEQIRRKAGKTAKAA